MIASTLREEFPSADRQLGDDGWHREFRFFFQSCVSFTKSTLFAVIVAKSEPMLSNVENWWYFSVIASPTTFYSTLSSSLESVVLPGQVARRFLVQSPPVPRPMFHEEIEGRSRQNMVFMTRNSLNSYLQEETYRNFVQNVGLTSKFNCQTSEGKSQKNQNHLSVIPNLLR